MWRKENISTTLHILLAVGCLFNGVFSQLCTTDDYTASYTQCEHNLRNLIYYWNEGVDCSGGVSLPANIYDLQCDIACGEGLYLPLGGTSCMPCAPGSMSVGGGERIVDFPPTWLDDNDFTTYCVDNSGNRIDGCGWTASSDRSFIQSGNITDLQSSILLMPVQLLVDGHIHFEYRVDAEPNYDLMSFYINGQRLLQQGNSLQFQTFQMNLTQGYYNLRWVYSKDISLSQGADATLIRMIEIGGTQYADSSCTPCGRGTYNDGWAAEDCKLCPQNTFSNETGAAKCTNCSIAEYSYPGADSCTPRPSCTTNDYESYYTPCGPGAIRQRAYRWLQPIICDTTNAQLPGPETVGCGPCNPGMYRSGVDFQCYYCAEGTYTAGTNVAYQCQPCSDGYAAMKQYNFVYWQDWPTGMTTSCTGNCGSPGWRLFDTYIDSGTGHGAYTDSSISISFNLEMRGSVTFNYTLQCSQSCHLEFTDEGYSSFDYYSGTRKLVTVPLQYQSDSEVDGGTNHTLTWTFHKTDPLSRGRNDKVIIYSIKINGVADGGASTCTGCTTGTYAPRGSSQCFQCPAGQSSQNLSTFCQNCPANYFNDFPGGPCLACGHGTWSASGSVNCTSNCSYPVFLPSTNETIVYDLSALIRDDEMYGPVEDSRRMLYYVNVCSTKHHNHTCYDPSGNAINSYACQITNAGWGADLGRAMGFYTYEPDPQNGVIISYMHGSVCNIQIGRVERSSNITFFCDPLVGVGAPVAFNGSIVEGPTCSYNFHWNSTYGCPVCSSADYSSALGQCRGGMQRKFYFWKTTPKRCHDGVALPPFESVPCTAANIVCPPGQFAMPAANGTQNCTSCPAGYYSVGTGTDFSSWNTLPDGFTAGCSNPNCQGWIPKDHSIDVSDFGTSWFQYTKTVAREGTLSFWTKFVPTYGSNATLTVYVDGEVVLVINEVSIFYQQNTVTHVSVGLHTFRWEFNQMTSPDPARASIDRILFNRTDTTASFCTPCPAGYTSDPGSSNCTMCPENTFSLGGDPTCTSCAANQFSYAGSDTCHNRPTCVLSDYVAVYTPCRADNTRDQYYVQLEPAVCTGSPSLPNITGVPCADCPPGTFRENGVCKVCDTYGWWYDGSSCKEVTHGDFMQNHTFYFIDNSLADFPVGIRTGCTGECGSDGWRFQGSFIDSGDHTLDTHGDVDSFVWTTFTINGTGGSISFDYNNPSPNPNELLEFYLDAFPVNLASLPPNPTIPLSAGFHFVGWNYHMPSGFRHIATLQNIRIAGTTSGIPIAATCPPGYYSASNAATSCDLCVAGSYSHEGAAGCNLCPLGFYSPDPGAAECMPCGNGSSTSSLGAIKCFTTCEFSAQINTTNVTYSLSGLSGTDFGPVFAPGGSWYINLCNSLQNPVCNNGGELIETAVCYITGGTAIDHGNALQFVPYDDKNMLSSGFYVLYQHGESDATCPNGRSTTVQFVCDAESSASAPSLAPVLSSACDATFQWNTIYGCPVCNRDTDYSTVYGTCIDGSQDVLHHRTGTCNGPIAIVDAPVSCKSTISFPIVAVVLGAVAFVILGVIAIVVFAKNRRMSVQYQKLQDTLNSKGYEMENLDSKEPESKFSIGE